MRSKWKGYFFNKNNINKSIILKNLINKNIKIYNGKNFSNLIIKKQMVGFKVGEFIFTRKINVIHKKKNKKNKLKKK